MKRGIVILFISFIASILPFESKAQVDTASVDDLVVTGDAFFKKKLYDSSLIRFLDALALTKKYKMMTNPRVTIIYNYIGDNYFKKKDPIHAHEYYTLALDLSRKLGIRSEKEKAITALSELHRSVSHDNLNFIYPPVAETEEQEIFFPIGKIKLTGDSVDVILLAGKLDGIGDSVRSIDLFTHHIPGDSMDHNDIRFIGTARVVKLENNNTLLRIKEHAKIELMPGDLGIVRANVPLSWRKLSLRKFLLSNLYLVDNYRQHHYHYRYFYYYMDSLLENDVLGAIKTSVDEIVEMYGEDTLTTEQLRKKNVAGIFAGVNVIRAMSLSGPGDIRLFLNFVNKFPARYISNNYKISETYATWVINNTPLDPVDVKPYLLAIADPSRRKNMVSNLKSDIQADNLIDKWLDEGLQQVNIENIKDATETAALIEMVTRINGDRINEGWGDYLFASIDKRMSRQNRADSFLNLSERKFRAAQNPEGSDWVSSTRQLWMQGDKITVGVQNGHMLPFTLAQSKNPRYFATGGADQLVKIWDRTLGKEVLTLTGHTDEVNSIQYSPNGRYLVSVGEDKLICVWNAYTYTRLYTYKTEKAERVVRFSPDNQFIVTAGYDSLIKFRELHTGKIVKTLKLHKATVNDIFFHPLYSHVLYSAGSDSVVYKWNIESGEMTHWYRQKGKILSVKISNDGQYMSLVSTDSFLTVWNTENHKDLFSGKIAVNKPGTVVFYSSESFSPDSKYIAFVNNRDSFVVIALRDLYERVYPAPAKGFSLSELQFTNDGTGLFGRYDMGGPLRIFNFAGWDIRNNPTISWYDIKPYANLLLSVQFTKDDNGLVVLHDQISKLDLQSGNNEHLFYGYSLVENPYLLLDDENIGTFVDNRKPILNFFDYKKVEIVQSFELPDSSKLACWELAPGSTHCWLVSEDGHIGGWDIKQNKKLFTRSIANTPGNIISYLRFDPKFKRLFAIDPDGEIRILDAFNGDSIDIIRGMKANYIVSSAQFCYITTKDGWLHKLDAVTLRPIKKIRMNDKGVDARYMTISTDHRFLVVQSSFQTMATILLDNDSVLYNIQDHDFGGTLLAISHDGKRIATAGFDSKIHFYQTETGKRIVSIYYPKERNVLIADEEGHYLASRHTLDAILLTYNNNAYSFDQFDVRLNRPDIILKKIGRADTSLLKTFEAAYKKRLTRMKINEKDIGGEVHLPLVRLPEKYALQSVTTKQEFELLIECGDSRYDLQSLQVLVNNSPLLGSYGMDLRALKTRSTTKRIKILLSSGSNSIKVFCTNTKGAVSLHESINIISKYKEDKPAQVYFIGIGISGYKDSRMNLKYAAKDIRDLAKTFDDLYANISFDTLIDKKVTRENILALKKKLMQTTVNDRVILAVTGHGLLSNSFDFYYATWDVDFNSPEKRGLKYEQLEDLLSGIPARQKLMLIDACHSGALDKEELIAIDSNPGTVRVVNKDNKGVKGIVHRGFGLKNKGQKMSANSSFEMMQNLFTDLSSSNGAIIISAAGGMEYAYEGESWNNGVFTYCVRQGINTKQADRSIGGNYDDVVSVGELLRYVSRRVSELTNGKQKPTSRRENIEFDWMLRY